jgi:thioredoxin 1
VATIDLTAESFQSTIDDNDIVLLDFWASWCGPCRTFGPIYEKVSEQHPDIVFGKVDTEAEQELAAQFGIRSIPTLAILRDNVLLFAQPGVVPADGLEDLISQVRDLDMEEVHREIEARQATA